MQGIAGVTCLQRLTWLLVAVMMLASADDLGADPGTLKVMTYNVRYASVQPPHAWSERRPLLSNLLRETAPDIIATQEGLYSQLNDIQSDLDGYTWIGLGRDGGSRGEFMAIFYRPERLEAIAFDHFWLSDTPSTIGSITWGPRFPRMVTWVRFRERKTGIEFFVWNTHLDHEVETARMKSAALIREQVSRHSRGFPVILAGDFNAAAEDSLVYDSFVRDGFLADTWTLAEKREGGDAGTFNGFGEQPFEAARIDWILVRGGIKVESAEILAEHAPGAYPSDHYPVLVELRLPAPAPADSRR